MGIIKNWKQGREVRIAAAKARGTPGYMPQSVDVGNNLAKKLTDPVIAMLEQNGILDNDDRVHCAAELFNATASHFKRIQIAHEATMAIIKAWTEELKASLSKYGITDNDKQELFILAFMDEIEKVS